MVFYLVNIGFITLRLSNWSAGPVELMPMVGSRIGVSVLVLGLVQFFNMWLIARYGPDMGRWVSENADHSAAVDHMAIDMAIDHTAAKHQPPSLPMR